MRTCLALTLTLAASAILCACAGSERTGSPARGGEDASFIIRDADVCTDASVDGALPPTRRPDAGSPLRSRDSGDRDSDPTPPAPRPRPSDAGSGSPAADASVSELPSPRETEDAGHAADDAGNVVDAAAAGPLCASCGGCEEVFPVTSRVHTTDPIAYPDLPPANGPHNPCWAMWGVHTTEVLDDRWVHNLEHGGVVFLHNCPQGCADEIAALERFATARRRTLLTPYAALPTRFGVVAWSHRLLTDCIDEVAFAKFYDVNFDYGVESNDSQPEASCPP